MCGINGICDFKQKYSMDELNKFVHLMNEQIIYRGPDCEGTFKTHNVAMGMRRLSIIDLHYGNQPVYSEDKSIVVVFNGEIYNYKTLRDALLDKYDFYTNSDTEVIIHAYEEYGVEMLDKLDGMFAFSLYDANKEIVMIARDRMGEKPLYYYKGEGLFLWGSELKSLLSTGLVPRKINVKALNQYLQLTYIPAPLTIYDEVYKMLPGHYFLLHKDGTIIDNIYWDIKNVKKINGLNYQQAQKKLYELAEKSVVERMVSDVPVGAFLSGGIDSSSIVGLMARNSTQPIETFTIGFKEKEYDERDRAQAVSRLNGTHHHEYLIDYKDVLETVDLITGALDEPFADSSMIPTYYVSRFASDYVKVVLTGDAGDELFLGYDKYLIGYYSKLLKFIPKWGLQILKKIVFGLPDTTVLTRKMRKVLNYSEKTLFEQRVALMSLGFSECERGMLLCKEYFDEKSMEIVRQKYYEQENVSELTRTQYTDLSIVLEGDMLTKVDRMSMLNSLETRTPLLSREIVEFAYAIPDEYKINGKRLKCIMKDTFADILPSQFDKLKKTGFGIPLDYWFRNQLKEMIEEYLNKDFVEQQGIFNWNYIESMLDEHYSGKVNHKFKIWTLFVFQRWYINCFND